MVPGVECSWSRSPWKVDRCYINLSLHCIFELFSNLMISWWCWFSNSFMKFWYFWINLYQEGSTSHARCYVLFSVPRSLVRFSEVKLLVLFLVCFLTDSLNSLFCPFWHVAISQILPFLTQGSVSALYELQYIFIVLPKFIQFFWDWWSNLIPFYNFLTIVKFLLENLTILVGVVLLLRFPCVRLLVGTPSSFHPNIYWNHWLLRDEPFILGVFLPQSDTRVHLCVVFRVLLWLWRVCVWQSMLPYIFLFFSNFFGGCRALL